METPAWLRLCSVRLVFFWPGYFHRPELLFSLLRKIPVAETVAGSHIAIGTAGTYSSIRVKQVDTQATLGDKHAIEAKVCSRSSAKPTDQFRLLRCQAERINIRPPRRPSGEILQHDDCIELLVRGQIAI
jgi:hypothetical protein